MATENKEIQEKDNINNAAVELYERIASEKNPSLHLGYYEKGAGTYTEANFNMNNFVGKLLGLDSIATDQGKVLDAGCGTGSTLLYLAKKYPTISFIGITISPKEVELALNAQDEKKIKNTKFFVENFNNTDFPNNSFDGVFALESIVYAEDKKKVLGELYRILKPNKRLVVVGAFLKKTKLNYFVKSAHEFSYTRSMHPPLENIENFKRYLKDVGFDEINVQDITKKTRLSFFIMNVISVMYFFKKKKYLKSNESNIVKNPLFHLVMLIYSPLFLFISRTFGYVAISAVKSKD